MAKLIFQGGNQLQLLQGGGAFFPHLLSSIEKANKEIYIETYIFATDHTGQTFIQALSQASQRQLVVRVIIDWVGSGYHRALALQAQLQNAGVDCRVFNPWFKRGLTRTHRKIMVIDRQTAYIGGINFIDDLHSDDGSERPLPYPRWDFAVAIQGNLVEEIHREIEGQWLRIGSLDWMARLKLTRHLLQRRPAQFQHEGLAALVVRDNLRHRNTIQKTYLKALGNAKQTAILANPYFSPGRKIRQALMKAAQRGVEVHLLLGVGEFEWQDALTQSYYAKLLSHGVKIYEYRKTRLHAKVAVIDQEWSTVGSSNFDGFSLFLNHEANLVVRDIDFCLELHRALETGLKEAVPIHAENLAQMRWWQKLKTRIAYSFYRVMMHLVTFGQFR